MKSLQRCCLAHHPTTKDNSLLCVVCHDLSLVSYTLIRYSILQEKEREKDRVKSSRGRGGAGLGAGVAVGVAAASPVKTAPPLPADIPQTRRRQSQPGDVSNGPGSPSLVRAASAGRYGRQGDDSAGAGIGTGGRIGSIGGAERDSEDGEDDGEGDGERERDGVSDNDQGGGYLKSHIQKTEKTPLRSRSSTRRGAGVGDEDEEGTVRSRTSSFSARSGGTKGKPGGRGLSAPSPYGGRSKTLSNIQQIKNAINLVCLAGGHFDVQRLEAVRAIETYSAGDDAGPVTQMLVLVTSSKSPSFKALYAVHPLDGKPLLPH